MSSPPDSHRLIILSAEEIDALYGLPRFTNDDRHLYFDLNPLEHAAVQARTLSVGVYLALELGYFKARRQFFTFELPAVADDLRYLLLTHFAGAAITAIKCPSKPTRIALQQTILNLVGWRHCDSAAQQVLQDKMERLARLSTQPLYVLREALQHLAIERIVTPRYTTMQDLVGRAVTFERNRVVGLLQKTATPIIEETLDALLNAQEQPLRLSALRHEPQDFSHQQLKREVERRQFLRPLHDFAQGFLAGAGLSNDSGKYFSSLVDFYTLYKLQRMPRGTARLYLLCFAFHRFRQINDRLIEAFIHGVDQYEQRAKQAGEAAMQLALLNASEHLRAAGDVLRLFIDPSIAGDSPFATVQQKAFALLEAERFAVMADYLRDKAFDKAAFQWACITTLARAFKLNLRHLFCELVFAGRVEDAPLLQAVTFLQDVLRTGKSLRQMNLASFPQSFIPKSLRCYLFTELKSDDGSASQRLEVDRYEFLVYQQLRNALEAGNLFVRDSNEFRRLEDDLICDTRWQQRDAVLQEIGAPLLLAPIEETLASLRIAVQSRFAQVNQRIVDGANQHIKIIARAQKRRWKLIYPTAEEPVNHSFYGQLSGIGIADLLRFVASSTGFLTAFSHVLDRYVKNAPDLREILACTLALGTNMGLGRMAEVSGLSVSSLQGTTRNYLRLETLHAAIDTISNATAKLPAFHLFDIRDELHSSSDGQRFETRIDTFNARHAPKYFGLQKGISACTLVANHVPINARIIGTHEHESHYVFDLLYNNTSDIKPRRHSTDTHGTNQVNFWILRVFGYGFAPRYRDLHKKMQSLVGFEHPSQYAESLIKPARKVDQELIVREWPNHSAHHGVPGAKGRHAGDHRSQAEQLSAAEPDQEGLVGARQYLPHAVHPGLY